MSTTLTSPARPASVDPLPPMSLEDGLGTPTRGELALSVTSWIAEDPGTSGFTVTLSASPGEPLVGFTWSFGDFDVEADYREYPVDATRTLGLVSFEVPIGTPWTFSAFGRYAGGARTGIAHLHA